MIAKLRYMLIALMGYQLYLFATTNVFDHYHSALLVFLIYLHFGKSENE